MKIKQQGRYNEGIGFSAIARVLFSLLEVLALKMGAGGKIKLLWIWVAIRMIFVGLLCTIVYSVSGFYADW